MSYGARSGSRSERFWSRYLGFVERRRRAILVVALLFTIGGGLLASRLRLDSDFSALLPKNAPSVLELDRIQERLPSLSTLVVAIEGGDWKAREAFVERAAVALRSRVPREHVSYIDHQVKDVRAFFDKHKLLYADFADLVTLRDRIKKKQEDVKRRTLVVDLEDTPPYELRVDDIEKKYADKAREYDRFPDGYFITPDRSLQILLLRLPSSGLAGASTDEVVDEVRRVLASLHPEAEGYRVLIGGDPVTAAEEREAVIDDIVLVSLVCVFFVGLVILLYFRSWRSLLLVGMPVAVGVAMAMGIAQLVIGGLNSNAAFLGSIIVGNGINFPIILLAVYIEERRRGTAIHDALLVALRQTWAGTATAALAASIAYGSLVITDFRGFNEFGVIGGIGMMLCWLASFLVLPALALTLERRWPWRIKRAEKERMPRFVARFVGWTGRYRVAFCIGGLVLTAAAAAVAVWFYRDPFEYDFRKLRSKHAEERGGSALGRRVDKIFEGTKMVAGTPLIILVDRPEQVRPAVATLRQTAGRGAIGRVESVYDYLPEQQEKKLPVLAELRVLLADKKTGWLTPEQRKKVNELRPPDDLRPLGLRDLPATLRRTFTEKNGTIGNIVFAYSKTGADLYEGKDLIATAEAVRELVLPSGEIIRTSGREVVLADILRTVVHDAPIATFFSFAGVVVLVALAFRKNRDRLLVLASLFAGVIWMAGIGALLGIKVNMLNFVVLPITFGIGVDYPVNVYRRYRSEGPQGLGRALWHMGGAVALCSLTTIIGYSSLLSADMRALSSFGLLAAIGEVTTLFAALVWMPALIQMVERRERRKSSRAQPDRASTSASTRGGTSRSS